MMYLPPSNGAPIRSRRGAAVAQLLISGATARGGQPEETVEDAGAVTPVGIAGFLRDRSRQALPGLVPGIGIEGRFEQKDVPRPHRECQRKPVQRGPAYDVPFDPLEVVAVDEDIDQEGVQQLGAQLDAGAWVEERRTRSPERRQPVRSSGVGEHAGIEKGDF